MEKAARTLSEVDYLLGVNDETRQGALRFSLKDGGPYLERVVLSLFEAKMAPGSSLGGARPKTSVRDKDSHLAIAKFPNDVDGMVNHLDDLVLKRDAMSLIHG